MAIQLQPGLAELRQYYLVSHSAFLAIPSVLGHLFAESIFNCGLKLRERYLVITVDVHMEISKDSAVELLEDLNGLKIWL